LINYTVYMASKGKILSKDETEMIVAVAYVKKDSAYHLND